MKCRLQKLCLLGLMLMSTLFLCVFIPIVLLITQSTATKKSIGDIMHPCRTPLVLLNHSVSVLLYMTLHVLNCGFKTFYDVDDFFWAFICFECLPKALSVNAVKRFFEVNEIYVHSAVPFNGLLYYIS